MIRIALAGITHETNTFIPRPTDLAEFEADGIFRGSGLGELSGTNTVVGGAWDEAALHPDVTLLPIVSTSAIPGGLVTRYAFDSIIGEMVAGLGVGQIDAVVLDLHGAMVTDFDDDGDAAVLQEVRQAVGPDVPIVAVLDLHANIGPRMVELANALIPYDTYPHVDNADRGAQAMRMAISAAKGEIDPVMRSAKLPLLPHGPKQYSGVEPTISVMANARRLEEVPGVLNVGVCFAFPYADCPFPGMTVLAITDGNADLAEQIARQESDFIWERRRQFVAEALRPDQAIKAAMEFDGAPVVLADLGDNPGGGTPADGTALLWPLLDFGVPDAVFALMADPAVVEISREAGVGAEIEVDLGGKHDELHGFPIPVKAEVLSLSDGDFTYEGPMNAGAHDTLGPTAVLRCQGRHGGRVDVIVSSRRIQALDAAIFRSQGIEPTEHKIVGLKSAVHFRGSFTPIAAKIIEVNTPGLTSIDYSTFPYKRLKRPIFPLDPLLLLP